MNGPPLIQWVSSAGFSDTYGHGAEHCPLWPKAVLQHQTAPTSASLPVLQHTFTTQGFEAKLLSPWSEPAPSSPGHCGTLE